MRFEDWEKKREAEEKARTKLAKVMTQEQKDHLKELDETISDIVQTLHECSDLWMSQVNKLDGLMYRTKQLIWDGDDAK